MATTFLRQFKEKLCSCGSCSRDANHSIITKIINQASTLIFTSPQSENLKKSIIENVLSDLSLNTSCQNLKSLLSFATTKSIYYFTKFLKNRLLNDDQKVKLKKNKKTDPPYRHYKLRIMKQ